MVRSYPFRMAGGGAMIFEHPRFPDLSSPMPTHQVENKGHDQGMKLLKRNRVKIKSNGFVLILPL